MARYELWLCNDRGERLELLEPYEFEFSRVMGSYGYFTGRFTFTQSFFDSIRVDFQVHLYRAPKGQNLELYNIYFIRNWSATDFQDHAREIRLSGPDHRELLERRINAYAVDNAKSLITDNADDIMKAVVNNNVAKGTTAARDWSNNNFEVIADVSLGPSITYAFGWKNVLLTLQKISQASAVAGTVVYFDLVASIPDPANPVPTFRFETYSTLPGRDLRSSTDYGFTFSKEFGNLSFVHYELDYSAEANYIYALGQGSAASRATDEVSDDDRINASIWNRRELVANASGASSAAGITAIANERLNEKRPRQMLRATLLDTDDTVFQKHWDVGDLVTVNAFGQNFDELIRAVSVKIGRDGFESINARFEHGSLMGDVVEKLMYTTKDLASRVEALEAEDKV